MKKTFFEKYALLILVLLAFSLPIMMVGVKRTLENVRNSMKEWLPDGTPEAALHTWFQQNFPNEQFILMSWDGCSLYDPRIEVMKHRLMPRRDARNEVVNEDFNLRFFENCASGTELAKTLSEGSSLKYEEAIGRLKGSLIGMDGVKTSILIYMRPGSEGENMKGAVGEIYRMARKEFVFDRRTLTPEELAAAEGILKELEGKEVVKEPPIFQERIIKLAVPNKPTEAELQREAIPPEDLIVLPGLQPSQLHLGGPPVDNVSIDVEGNRTLLRLAWMAAVVGFVIASLCLRSFRLVLVVFASALMATGFALSLVNFTGASTDAIMLSMPPLVYVLTMSSSIHFINYYHDALEEVGGVHGAVEHAVKLAFVPVVVSAVTTTLGLFSLMTSNLLPIWNFGLYSGLGVIISLFFIFLFLPSYLQLFPSHRFAEKMAAKANSGEKIERKDVIGAQWQKIGHFIIWHPYLVMTFCSLLLCMGFAGLPQLLPSVKLMNFFKSDTTIIRDYTWLEENLGPLVPMEVLIRFDNERVEENFKGRLLLVQEAVEAIQESLVDKRIGTPDAPPPYMKHKLFFNTKRTSVAEEKQVGGVISAVTMLPDPMAGTAAERAGWNGQVLRNYPVLKDNVVQDLEAAERKYRDRAKKNGEKNLSPSLAEMEIPAELAEKAIEAGMTNLEELRAGIGKAQEGNLFSTEELAEIERRVYQWQVSNGDELFRITCRVKALTDVDYGDFVNELRKTVDPVVEKWLAEKNMGEPGKDAPVQAIYTGSVPLVYKTQHELMRSLYQSILMAFVTISIIMMIMLKSVIGGFLAMIPNVFPIAVVFGMMAWLGVLCDLGAMMTASVALGIATDDTIHYLTWYRRALDEGLIHREAALSAYRRCATAMTQSTFVAALGLSVFAFSTFTPTLYFGVMMLLLLFMALFGDLIYLPSILTLSGGLMFAKRRQKENAAAALVSPVENPVSESVAEKEVSRLAEDPFRIDGEEEVR